MINLRTDDDAWNDAVKWSKVYEEARLNVSVFFGKDKIADEIELLSEEEMDQKLKDESPDPHAIMERALKKITINP